MTLIETRPETAPEIQLVPLPQPEPAGFAAYLGTGDHKKIGRLFIAVSLVYLAAAVVLGAVLSVEQIDQSGFDIFDAESYFQALTLGEFGLVFLALLPLFLGLAIYVVPLQVGARTIAFPRAAAVAFWGYLLGGALLVGSYLINGGPGGGDEQGVDLWILAVGIVAAALLVGALCVATTVITLRTPGMYLDRVPLFSWSMLVSAVLWIGSLPVLVASLVLGYLDHKYGRVEFGGNYDLYPWYHWTLRQPQVFLYAVPAVGIAAEVIPVMAGTRQRLYKTIMALIAVVGLLGFGAYTAGLWTTLVREVATLDISTSDWSIYSNWVFFLGMITLPLPLLLLLGGWADTVVRGNRRQLSAPLVFSVVAILLLLAAATAAALSAIEPLDLLPTSWVHGVAVLAVGASVLAALGGLQYWGIKIWGRSIPAGAGLLAALLGFGGVLLIGAGQLLAGVYDQPDLVTVVANGASAPFDGVLDVRDAVDTGNVITTIGWAAAIGAVVVFGLGLIGALVKPRSDDEEPEADPWGGHTLEWATSSPPPFANFEAVALVTSCTPLLDERDARPEVSS
jgi:heme/copper-type cytochrome/quinol oxidase subunit 1